MRLPARLLLPAFLAAIALSGCGPKGVPRAEVSGQVKFRGQPLPVGTVTFVSQGSTVVESGAIKDGQYSIARAPVGPVKISVSTPEPANPMQMKQKVEGKAVESASNKVMPVPPKYGNADKSGLTYTVTAEKTQTYDITLP